MKLKWTDHYNMGIEAFDRDHRQLFKIAERIIDTVQDADNIDERTRLFVIREGVKYLRNYFEEHAAREEAYMRQVGYHDYVTHKRLHDEFQDVQLVRFEGIIERGTCTRDEILDFVGLGIGWLLEHISTADMAIVGKGVLCRPKAEKLDAQVLEREVTMLFAATLNIDVNAKIINPNYGGDYFGEAVYQKFIYEKEGQPLNVVAGIEKSFLLSVARAVYGEEMAESEALILATLEIFGANFWRTLGERLITADRSVEFKENHFLSQREMQATFASRLPVVSLLFDSRYGKFFIASDDPTWHNRSLESAS